MPESGQKQGTSMFKAQGRGYAEGEQQQYTFYCSGC